MINFWPNNHILKKEERKWLVKASVSKDFKPVLLNFKPVDVILCLDFS